MLARVSDQADIFVSALSTTPVKGLRVAGAQSLTLGASGDPDNRRFYLVDERRRMVNGKNVGELSTVIASYDHDERALALTFEDGCIVTGTVKLGDPIDTRFFSRSLRARPVLGPFSDALAEHLSRELRLVEAVDRTAVDRGRSGGVSLISRASLAALADAAGEEAVDARRFRMLIEIDGVAAHEEDEWVGARVRIGEVLVRFGGHVGRCLITSRDPESGVVDLPTLDVIRDYRAGVDATEPLPFGIYGAVVEPGRVAVGDAVSLEG
jgi:uncharacterized protein YcbX